MRFKAFITIGIAAMFFNSFFVIAEDGTPPWIDVKAISEIDIPNPADINTKYNIVARFIAVAPAGYESYVIPSLWIEVLDHDTADSITKKTGPIQINKEYTVQIPWKPKRCGHHFISWNVNQVYEIGEPDYQNNHSKVLEFSVNGCPDLRPFVDYEPNLFSENEQVKYSITIVNVGTASTNPSNLQIWHGNSMISNINVFPLKPNAKTVITHFWKAKCNEVTKIIVDALNQNKELSEDDNIWSEKMVCWKRPINTKYEHYKRLH